MSLRLGPRFLVEAAFLVAVAVAAALLDLSTPAIVGVMAAAWLAVAVFEWALSRRGDAREREPVVLPPDVAAEPALDAEPLPEPIPPEPVSGVADAAAADATTAEGAPPPLREPISPGERPELVAVPDAPPAEPEPTPEPEPEPEPARAAVVELDAHRPEPREWNLWELERAVRGAAGEDAARDEERSFLLVYLREFAGPDGSLPVNFDALVRDAFGELLGSARR